LGEKRNERCNNDGKGRYYKGGRASERLTSDLTRTQRGKFESSKKSARREEGGGKGGLGKGYKGGQRIEGSH